MPEMLFDAMTGSVRKLVAKRRYGQALDVLERYLRLFPDYVPALQQVAQICHDWVAPTSTAADRELICAVSRRARPWATRLDSREDLEDHPLATLELARLCREMSNRFYHRLDAVVDDDAPVPLPVDQEHLQWADHTVCWTRMMLRREPHRGNAVRHANALFLAIKVHAAAGDIDRARAEQDERQHVREHYSE
jgi:hypothetical protein